jgi:hypothetical protein
MKLAMILVMVQLSTASVLSAQRQPALKIRGDTTGAPHGCSARAAADGIAGWFVAFAGADSTALARFTAKGPRFHVFSSSHFTPAERTRIESVARLIEYARERSRYQDQMTLEGMRFYGWRGWRIGFMPYYQRRAADLGPKPIAGIGKGEYTCAHGISILNLAPRPRYLPGLE